MLILFAKLVLVAFTPLPQTVSVAPPPVRPAYPTKPAMPLNMESWLKDKDYPKEARRAGAHGTSSFRLEIDRKGRVTACTMTGSSGTPILDETTCSVLLRRARFSPAEDRDGNPIAAHYSNRFRWSLSE